MIGLTGGLASGKSNIRKDLEGLGAATIDCDKLGTLLKKRYILLNDIFIIKINKDTKHMKKALMAMKK